MPTTRGALAMFDALGFKGIWNRYAPEQAVNKLKGLRAATQERIDALREGDFRALKEQGLEVETHVAFVSDTIVIGVTCVGDTPFTRWASVSIASQLVSGVLLTASVGDVPLTYRGAMAYGDYYIDAEFIVGRAVDEAAEAMDAADGAFVWLTCRRSAECAAV